MLVAGAGTWDWLELAGMTNRRLSHNFDPSQPRTHNITHAQCSHHHGVPCQVWSNRALSFCFHNKHNCLECLVFFNSSWIFKAKSPVQSLNQVVDIHLIPCPMTPALHCCVCPVCGERDYKSLVPVWTDTFFTWRPITLITSIMCALGIHNIHMYTVSILGIHNVYSQHP